MNQEEAKFAGLLVCPLCGKLGDAMSEHQFFEYNVLAIRCTPCMNFTIAGACRWILQPRVVRDRALLSDDKPHLHYLDSVQACNRYEAAHEEWNREFKAMAKSVHVESELKTWRDRPPFL